MEIYKTSSVTAKVRYILILTWLRGFRDKIANIIFHDSIVLKFPEETSLSTKKTKSNIEKWREDLGVMLEYSGWYLVREVGALILIEFPYKVKSRYNG